MAEPDRAERLRRLDELRAMGLLTDLDYVYHRGRIERGEDETPSGETGGQAPA